MEESQVLYIYRRAASEGARELAETIPLNCRKLNDLNKAHFGKGVRTGDFVICWGEGMHPMEGVKVLNAVGVQNKYEDATKLRQANIPTIEVNKTRPSTTTVVTPQTYDDLEELLEAAGGFANSRYDRNNPIYRDCVKELAQEFQKFHTWLSIPIPPPPPPATWLGRRYNHVGGSDLLRPSAAPDFFVKKENLTEEFRIHSFLGKSIRAGVKHARDGVNPHPWIRSYDAGWFINYANFESTKAMRELAHGAVHALGLDFGAVDIGRTADNRLIVLEVNRAPGVEDGTVNAYSNAIVQWMEGGSND